jgi:cyclophilin family peptidyl-prolyl cis-trans isomerase
MRRFASFLIALVAVGVASCGGDRNDAGPSAGGIDSTQLAPGAPAPAAADTTARLDTAGPTVTHVATISTDSGDVEIELFGEDAPKTVKNFVELAKKGYYDGIAFHRVIPGFVAQAGDPQSRDESKRAKWGTGGESIYGGTFDDELDSSKPSARLGYAVGTVAMANAGPNTNGSQFFIVVGPAAAQQLKYSYTIFGRVRSGQDAVARIESTGFQGEVPTTPARIKTITVRAVGA